ncbi:MAG: hypothetical protein HRT88_19330 [Lentisphaeraceae bacterium]|nr:hypothetical protein [Lentisphaeraceae bacterium]
MKVNFKHTALALSFLALPLLAAPKHFINKGQHLHVKPQHLKVHGDLEVTVWAKSPLLFNPTIMDTDSKGRIWVTEAVNYRMRYANRRPGGDRVVVLEDSNGDGQADKSHTFVEDKELKAPLGIAIFDNKVIVSQPPNLLIYTDVNRDLKFDPQVDTKEIFLTGFNGENHDHSLHATIAGPNGRLIINQGNCGAQVTDKSKRTFYFGGSYRSGRSYPFDPRLMAGKTSADGHAYTGGFIASVNADGTGLKVEGYNFRNSYEHTINSLGEVFQSDNDHTIS